jgi:hypothetical protein
MRRINVERINAMDIDKPADIYNADCPSRDVLDLVASK